MSTASAAFVPFRLSHSSLGMKAVAVALGTAFLAAASWIEVPMVPVPMTMQTFAVLVIGALYGWRLGAATVVAWLAEAAVGLPVLSGGAGGLPYFAGPTAGYLVSFPLVAALVGWCAERGWTANGLARSFAVMLAGHAVCLALGTLWLSTLIGMDKAIAFGLTPFLAGSVLKSALAVATVEATRRAGKRAR